MTMESKMIAREKILLSQNVIMLNDLVQISDYTLASSSNDKTIRVWDLTKTTCGFALQGHTGDVVGLKYTGRPRF